MSVGISDRKYKAKDKLSSIDLHYLVQELQVLVGSRLDKVSGSEHRGLFEFYVTSKGKQFLHAKTIYSDK